jgi:hypothetical protein
VEDFIVGRAPNHKDVLSCMLLAWAGADRSSCPERFEVIVPPAKSHDSVCQWMMEIFDELCSIVPRKRDWPSKIKTGKVIMYLRIHKQADILFSLAKVLLPYRTAPDFIIT